MLCKYKLKVTNGIANFSSNNYGHPKNFARCNNYLSFAKSHNTIAPT